MLYFGLFLVALGICGETASFLYALYNMYRAFEGKPTESIFKGHIQAMAGMFLSGIIGFVGFLIAGAGGFAYALSFLN